LFEDDLQHQSPVLRVSRLTSIELTAAPPSVAGDTLSAKTTIAPAVDPVLGLSVLTPWGSGHEALDPYLYELAESACDEGESAQETAWALREYLRPHLPTNPPAGWQFRLSEPQLELDAGETSTVTVELTTPSAGSAAFAIQAVAAGTPEPLAGASDVFVVEKQDDQPPRLLIGDAAPSDWHPPESS
jgi:hypothetical protein